MKIACLFSGGKDSEFAAQTLVMRAWDVELVTILPLDSDTLMFHKPNLELCSSLALCMNLPHHYVKSGDELDELGDFLKKHAFDGVATGAIESEFQKEKVDIMAHKFGLLAFSPIWRTGSTLLNEQAHYTNTVLVSASAEGLTEKDLLSSFDSAFMSKLSKLEPKVNLHLEGGEGETLTLDAIFFDKRLEVTKWETEIDGQLSTLKAKKFSVINKSW